MTRVTVIIHGYSVDRSLHKNPFGESFQVGRVHKKRILFLIGRTRVHLDRVEALGEFLELEVVLSEAETLTSGEAVATDLMEKLGINPGQLIEEAYVDMLAKATS